MHMHSLAPVLSATSRYVYCMIMTETHLLVVSRRRGVLPPRQPDPAQLLGVSSRPAVVVGTASPTPCLTTRNSRQCLVFDSGRVSMISTVSPTRDSLFSSWTWQMVRR